MEVSLSNPAKEKLQKKKKHGCKFKPFSFDKEELVKRIRHRDENIRQRKWISLIYVYSTLYNGSPPHQKKKCHDIYICELCIPKYVPEREKKKKKWTGAFLGQGERYREGRPSHPLLSVKTAGFYRIKPDINQRGVSKEKVGKKNSTKDLFIFIFAAVYMRHWRNVGSCRRQLLQNIHGNGGSRWHLQSVLEASTTRLVEYVEY